MIDITVYGKCLPVYSVQKQNSLKAPKEIKSQEKEEWIKEFPSEGLGIEMSGEK